MSKRKLVVIGGDAAGLIAASKVRREQPEREIIEIDLKNKRVRVKNLDEEKVFREPWDDLLIATGASPIVPKMEKVYINKFTLSQQLSLTKKSIPMSNQNQIMQPALPYAENGLEPVISANTTKLTWIT